MPFPRPSWEFYRRLSPRERLLSLVVGGTLLFVLNLIVVAALLRASGDLRAQVDAKTRELRLQNLYAQEQPMWKQRADWLRAKQPPLVNRDRAGTDLLGEIQAAGRVNRVVLTGFQITPGAGERATRAEDYQAVSVSVKTQSDWASLVQFLAALQRPEGFVVFDAATLRSDAADPQRMEGTFKLSKWYASTTH